MHREIDGLIDSYFQDCEGRFLEDAGGERILDRAGMPVRVDERAPTLAGLAVALDLPSVEALYALHSRAEHAHAIGRALCRIEDYAASRLFDKDTVRGAEFTLRYNHHWGEAGGSASEKVVIVDDV